MLNAPAIQVGDALAPVRRALVLRKVLRWTLWGLAAGAVLGTVLLAATRTASPRLNAVRQAALAHLHAISRELAAGLTPQQRRSPAAKQALSTISHLEAQLKRAGTQEEALRDISQAQTRLQHLNARLHPVSG